ncbi:MAG: tetratricopeptide repeat protein [Proteobacteria bacterium]|nr:tetratricopeptide repeat protein [Pseudomonadota bacterium]MBU1715357.1 tetratricopeptide repeat protein [Pseudomonadota bacterium]
MHYIIFSATIFLLSFTTLAQAVPISEFTKAIEQSSPENKHKFYQYRARAYLKENMINEALSDLTAAINLSPTVSAHKERGEIYFKQKRYQESIPDLSASIKENPNDLNMYRMRSQSYFATEAYAAALADAKHVLSVSPDDAICKFIHMESTTALNPEKEIIIHSSYVPTTRPRSPLRRAAAVKNPVKKS